MDNSKQRKIGAILSYITIILTTLIQLLYTPFLIGKLGQSEYGLYSLVNSIIGYLTVLDLGFGNAIIVYTAKYRAQGKQELEKKLHGMFRVVFLTLGLLAMIIGIFLFFNVNFIFGKTMTSLELHKTKIMMLILTFNLGFSFSFNIYTSIINAYEKFVFQKILALIGTVLKPLLMIPLLFLGYKSITMTIVLTLINVIIMLSNYFYCRKKLDIKIKFTGFDKTLFKTIFAYSIWIFVGTIVDKINWNIDNFILGAVSGTLAVSIYSIAGQLNTVFVNLSTAISGVLLPKVSMMVAEDATPDDLTKEFIKVGRIQFYVVFYMVVSLVIFGKHFINWWLGSGFEESYYCMLLLTIPVSIPLIQNIGISIRQAMNKHKFAAIVNIAVAIVNLISSIFLAKMFGPIGSSLGTGIGIIVSIIIINIYYHISLKLNMLQFWSTILKMIIIQIIPVGLTILTIHFIDIKGIFNMIIVGLIYTFIYGITNYLLTANDYEKGYVKTILNKIGKRVKK